MSRSTAEPRSDDEPARAGVRVVVVVALLVVALVVATVVLFVRAPNSRPQAADAVVVLGGDGRRVAMGERLVREGIAPVLAESVGSPYDPCWRAHQTFTVLCFYPQPFTTQGEARWLAASAKQHGWHRVIVVVSVPQATRARLRISRCYGGSFQIVAVHLGAPRMVVDAIYEWGAMLKALTLQRGC